MYTFIFQSVFLRSEPNLRVFYTMFKIFSDVLAPGVSCTDHGDSFTDTFKLVPKNFVHRLNLRFWTTMGCDIARFNRRGLQTSKILVLEFCPQDLE